jgi:aryl-alcohol dehydrogenase-like predicted oxidoreductase
MEYVNLGQSGLKVSRICLGTPIIGATKMPHPEQTVAALEIGLSSKELTSLEEPYQPHPVLGHG